MTSTTRWTTLLDGYNRGDAAARHELLAELYGELHRRASRRFGGEPSRHTLQPTALVHEAYLKLTASDLAIGSREDFFALAATAMRRILVDHARRRRTLKRSVPRAEWVSSEDVAPPVDDDYLVALDAALDRLEGDDPELAAVVSLRLFAGRGVDETATLLRLSPRTVKRRWQHALAWLQRDIQRQVDGASS